MRAHSSYFRRKNSKKGLALSTAMAICIVLAILVALLVSMASLNITTTQATVNQREAYVQAKSAISFVESYYSKHGDKIPGQSSSGSGEAVGEGLVVFKTNKISDGASFYETKAGYASTEPNGEIKFAKTIIADEAVENLRKTCPDTYVNVQNVTVNTNNVLILEAVCKYGDNNAYTLTKQYTIGGEEAEENPFTGSPIYTGKANTRFVRFHVRSTTAFQGTPYFYMWYNGISPAEGSPEHNPWVTSSVESKLTHNRKYLEITNGTWGGDGPEGACAMSYEGNGWYVTQKTLNLTRNVNYVNGIITKTGAHRTVSENENDWNQQSFEIFGIPIPNETQTSKENGMDIYFELVTEDLQDMQNKNGKDAFAQKYRDFADGSGDGGREQLNKFVKWMSKTYMIYVKTETAIMHYRKAGLIDYDANVCPAEFTYEGYGWYRRSTHNFSDTGPGGFLYTTFRPISQNQFGQEKIYESFVVEADDGSIKQFATEEEANRWLIKKGDLNAGNYIEVNVNAANQPIDDLEEHGAKITYETEYYSGTGTVPTHAAATNPAAADEEPEVTDLDVKDDELEFMELGADKSYGENFYIIGPDYNNDGIDMKWDDLDYKMSSDGSGNMEVVVPTTPGTDMKFMVIQKQDKIYYDYGYGGWRVVADVQQDEWGTLKYSTHNVYKYSWGRYTRIGGTITNFWGDSANADGYKIYTPETDQVKIIFNLASGQFEFVELGGYGEMDDWHEPVSATKKYSIIGWCNDWGTSRDGETSADGAAHYNFTYDMYTDVDGNLTYSDTNIRVRTGDHPKFMVAIRDEGVNVGSTVDWTRVIDANGDPAQTSSDPAQRYVMPVESAMTPYEINVPADDKGRDCDCYVTFSFVPDPDDSGKYKPKAVATPVDDVGRFFVIGQFNGWYPEDKDTYAWEQASSYQMEQVRLEGRKLVFTYQIPSVQEGADEGIPYTLRVIGTASRKTEEVDGKHLIDYDKTWGSSVSATVVRNENGIERTYETEVSQGQSDVSYTLHQRSVVKVTFKYDPVYPDESKIIVEDDSTKVDDPNVAATYVGFHNDKLTNVNEATNHLSSEFGDAWEHVYATYYTEATGLNCRSVNDIDGTNYWAKIPVDAEYVYFSNKPTNIYRDFHSEDFQFTEKITNDQFSESTSVIFFPIKKETDTSLRDVERTLWTVGDSKDYYEWINTRTPIHEVDVDMAYYGSTQCNYYDAPFVNVLNMLVADVPKPGQKYAFSSYPWQSFTVGGWEKGRFQNESRSTVQTISFNANQYVNYRGEKYYYTPISFCNSSFMLLCNPISGYQYNANNDYMYAYLFEDQMSLERNSSSKLSQYGINTGGVDMSTKLAYPSDSRGGWIDARYVDSYWRSGWLNMRSGATSYYSRNDSSKYYTSDINSMEYGRGQFHSSMYMYNRAGGAFVSDFQYKEGRYVTNASGGQTWERYPSPFNYKDYTPTWYTYRIPVSSTVQIEHVQIISTEDDTPAWVSVAGSATNNAGNTYKFEPVPESANVNRPIYFYRNSKKHNQVFTYNLKEGSVDGTADGSGNVTTSVYFANNDSDAWDTSKICVHAYTPTSEGVYLKAGSGSDFYLDSSDKNRGSDYYYKFDFAEGDYCYFQFYEGTPDANGLKNASKKSKVLYLTGEELGNSSDYYEDEFSGLDERTTRILCNGSASSFTWYMHPRTSVMHAYLDMDTVNQMLTDTKYYGYNPSSGSYLCHDSVSVGSFGSRSSGKIHDLEQAYINGNVSGGGWSVQNLTSVGQGLLRAASDYIDLRSQARMFIADDISQATSSDWTGPNQLVYLEGELMEESAYTYDEGWTNNFRSVYKALEKNSNSIYNRSMNETEFTNAANSLRIWIENPVATMKKEAVMVVIDNNRYDGKGGVNEKALGLYVKDAITGWRLFTNEIYQTTQDNFYCYIFMLPSTMTEAYGRPFTVAMECPHEYAVDINNNIVADDSPDKVAVVDKVGGPDGSVITTCDITPGVRYRCNTYYDYDSPNYFRSDNSKETKTYSGTEIKWDASDEASPTKNLNKFVGLSGGNPFQVHFKYDTTVKTESNGTYTIRAGYYEISPRTYEGFYSDFGSSPTEENPTTGIDVYSSAAKSFFTEPQTRNGTSYMSYGMKSAQNYSTWNGNRGRTGHDIDIMASKLGGTSTTLSAIEPNNRVNFRWNGVHGQDNLVLKNKGIYLKGDTVTVAVNELDLRNSGSNDFTIETGNLIFYTDCTVRKADGTTSIIEAGQYVYMSSEDTLDYYKISLKSTTVQDRDWRRFFQRVEKDSGSKLIGGKFVDK